MNSPGPRTFSSPILVAHDLKSKDDHFGAYLSEILATEGFTTTKRVDVQDLTQELLEDAAVLVLYNLSATERLTSLLGRYLLGGGGVLSVKPPSSLGELLGFQPVGKTLENGYWTWNQSENDVGSALQFHAQAECWERRDGAVILGSLGPSMDQVDAHPAFLRTIVSGAGRAVSIAFDPAKSIAQTRQGNRHWTGEGDGYRGYRPLDMLARLDGQKWNDPQLVGIPQADVLQRTLVNLLYDVARVPVPKMWYFPGRARTVVSFVCDSDGATGEQISNQLLAVTAHGGEASLFMIDFSIENTLPFSVDEWRSFGHEVSIHPDYGRLGDKQAPTAEIMRNVVGDMVGTFEDRFGFRPQTCRTHGGVWVGWAEQARLEREHGLRLNSTWTHWPWVGTRLWGGEPAGYVMGSGQPQKFVDQSGEIIDNYQACVHMTDQTLQTWLRQDAQKIDSTSHGEAQSVAASGDPRIVMAGLTPEQAFTYSRRLVERSESGFYSYLMFSFHPITYLRSPFSRRWQTELFLPYLRDRDILMWSTKRVLSFLEERKKVKFDQLSWDNGVLSFDTQAPLAQGELTVMVPAHFRRLTLRTVSVDGRLSTLPDLRTLLGREYALVTLTRSHHCIEAVYG